MFQTQPSVQNSQLSILFGSLWAKLFFCPYRVLVKDWIIGVRILLNQALEIRLFFGGRREKLLWEKKMSSSVQQNSCEEFSWHRGDARCYCGLTAMERTAWTDSNPGRRFIGCCRYKVRWKRIFVLFDLIVRGKWRFIERFWEIWQDS